MSIFTFWSASLVGFVSLGNDVTAQLSANTRQRLFMLRNVTSVAGYLGLAALAVWALTVSRLAGMALFTLVAFANYFISGAGGEQLIPLAKLRTRITRRVAFRVIAIISGTVALVSLLVTIRSESDQQNANFSFAMGTFLAAGAASLKVHSRSRKLCTQINGQTRSLILALDSLSYGAVDELTSRIDSTRREWHKLKQMLENRIETGLPLHSSALLPAPNRLRLEGLVNMALADTPQGTLFALQARSELGDLADACGPRIDTTL
ncbi:hypothetical protein ACGFY7_49855 [Streptomyces prunicolor]|uniref:hypothetical protein n=1 Tax=Streptomyces prunicolor TaxID=67348 RepID=UPI003723EC04